MRGEVLTPANSTPYLMPTTAQNQQFNISLNGTVYQVRIKWNSYSNAWILYINDDTGTPILSGVPLVGGADLLEQFAYLGLGGAMVVQCSNDPNAIPDYANLGTVGNLFFLTPIPPNFIA